MHDWLRLTVGMDHGDNCYSEDYRYHGFEDAYAGLKIRVTWLPETVVVQIPLKMLRSPAISKADTIIKQLGYFYSYTVAFSGGGNVGDYHHYFTGDGTEMKVQRVGSDYTFTSPLPSVE
jgi:hypothetical protein